MSPLTPREQQVLALIVSGKSTKQLAFALGIAFRTAVCHRYRIFKKLGVHNTAELVLKTVGLDEANASSEEDLRERLHDARLRLHAASTLTRKTWEEFKALELPLQDSRFAYQKALLAECHALAEYQRILRAYTDLVVHGKVTDGVNPNQSTLHPREGSSAV